MAKLSREEADFILGREHRKTPAYGMQTLTLPQPYQFKIIDSVKPEHCKHICFGPMPKDISKTDIVKWLATVRLYLNAGNWCTLEISMSHWDTVQESPLVNYPRFILLVKLPLANVDKIGYNACIVIDDTKFGGSNGGVWTHELHNLRQRQYFTRWDEYSGNKNYKFNPPKNNSEPK